MRTCPSCKKLAPDEAGFCPGCGTQYPIVRAKGGMSGKAAVILVVAICIPLLIMCLGIISAIAIPNLLEAIERSRQKRAVGEVRTLATAIEAYETDRDTPPILLSGGGGPWEEVDASQLQSALAPEYLKSVPVNDPWGRPYLYGFNIEEKSFYLLCLGRNGAREIDPLSWETRKTHCYESDILFAQEDFVQMPEGRQRVCGEEVASSELAPVR